MESKTKVTDVTNERCEQCTDHTQEKMLNQQHNMWIYCDNCKTWLHATCENLDDDEAKKMITPLLKVINQVHKILMMSQ